MTQKDIAAFLGVHKATYASWERGQDLFPLKRLLELSNYYQVSLDYIIGLTDTKAYEDLKPNIDTVRLQERLRTIRKENNYTQEKLADILNTTHSAISTYENGRLGIPLIILYQMCQMFHVSMDYLLGRTNHKYPEKELVSQIN